LVKVSDIISISICVLQYEDRDKNLYKKETPNNFSFGVGHRILSYVGFWLKR
jgi:hypothetical protein